MYRSKPYKVVRLDARYSFHNEFTHRLEVMSPYNGDPGAIKRSEQFSIYRHWCWEQFGPSTEASYWAEMRGSHNSHLASDKWAWYINVHDHYRAFLYFADPGALALFRLNWPDTFKQ